MTESTEETGMRTTLDKPFQSYHIKNPVEIIESDGLSPPAFLNHKNMPFDKYYRKIDKDVTFTDEMKKTKTNIFTGETFPLYFDLKEENNDRMPSPLNFESYDDYKHALVDWYTAKTKTLSSALLPSPLAGEFYSPISAKVFTKDEKNDPARFRTFKPTTWPLLPNNYMLMLDMIEKNEEINPDEEFPEQYPKREKILMKHHITSSPQWMSQEIPQEPIPELYDTIEDYEAAYRRWATLADEAISVPIPTVEEFEQLALIDVVEPDPTPPVPEPIKKETPEFPFDPRLQRLVDGSAPINKQKIRASFMKMKTMEESLRRPTIKVTKGAAETVTFTTGADSETFLEEMTAYGHQTNFKTRSPIHPTSSYTFVLKDQGSIMNMIFSCSEVDMQIIELIIKEPLSINDYAIILKTTVCGTQVAQEVVNVLSTAESLREFINRAHTADSISFNASVFLNTLFSREDLDTKLFSIFSNNSNNGLLYELVKLVGISNANLNHVYGLIESEVDNLHTINRMYLFSALFEMFADKYSIPIFGYLREQCQKLSLLVSRILKKKEIRELIQNDLKENEMNAGTSAALMIVSSFSNQAHRFLVGPKFIEWIDTVSNSKNGVNFIQSLSHSFALDSLSELYLSSAIDISKLLDTISSQTCDLLAKMFSNLYEFCLKRHISFNGDNLIKAFRVVATNPRECVSVIVAPMASIISSESIIKNINTEEYQKQLTTCINDMCKTISGDSIMQYRQQLLALHEVIHNKSCMAIISKNPVFITELINHLDTSDSGTLYLSWIFFKKLIKEQATIEMIRNSKENTEKISTFSYSKNMLALNEFLDFSISLFNHSSKDQKLNGIKKAWIELIESPARVITSYYLTRHKKYKGNVKTQQYVKTFVDIILKDKSPEMSKMREECKKVIKEEKEKSSHKK